VTVQPLVLTGTVVTYDDAQPVVRDGAVYLGADGLIEAVQARRRRGPAGFAQARRVVTNGVITPGLIDLHNHLAYNTLPLWEAPRDTPYTSRHQWPSAATYGRDVSNPAQALGITAAAATLRYAEVRAAAGGVTSIQGSPPVTRAFAGWMVRNIEKEQIAAFGKQQLLFQAVIKADVPTLRRIAPRLAEGRSFVYHLAEGTAPALRGEYADLREAGCVHPNLIGIHSTALRAADFADWADRGAGAIVWSPFSNIWLYGSTTDVLAARRHGHLVCLGSDWGPSGTKNLLGELKVAALWNDEALDGALDARELGMMATANAGDALRRCWGVDVGRLRAGALADVLVTASHVGARADPHVNLLRVDERAVRLVVVGGRPVLGTRSVLAAAGATHVEALDVGGVRKGVVMRLPTELLPADPALHAEANASWHDCLATLRRVGADPRAAVHAAVAARERRPRGAAVPLEFELDMPLPVGSPDGRALTDDELDHLVKPPVPSLAHDATWFAGVERARPHAAMLRHLRRRWRWRWER
jgi:cytosine/adenosine deaminase-related metal-dependent hydrolase